MFTSLRPFERSLPMSLLRARAAVMKQFTPHLREQGLSPQQWRVMRVLLEEDGLYISEIAERSYLLMPSLSRIIQTLEEQGLLERNSEVKDQRRCAISLTAKGRQLVDLIAVKAEDCYQQIERLFGFGKLELLYDLLDELIEKLEEPAP